MTVLEGQLGIEISGHERVITPDDGEVVIRKWKHHRLWPDFGNPDAERTIVMLSGQASGEVHQLDTLFFLDWYGYQDECLRLEREMDLVQVICVSGWTFLFTLIYVP